MIAARRPEPNKISQFLLALLPLGAILLAYVAALLINKPLSGALVQGAPNGIGSPLHITEPVAADRWLFGDLPSRWLQEHFADPAGSHWYDAVGAVVYVSHFLVLPAVAVVLWFRNRSRFQQWIACVLVLTAIGVATYVFYPMAPPWLAAQLGVIGGVQRISASGWTYLHLDVVAGLLGGSQAGSNPVAAMPSLHAATPMLVLLFFWASSRWWSRSLFVLYVAAMALTVVYTGEHYVVDVLAGWLAAGVAVVAVRAVRRWWESRRPGPIRGRPPALVS